MDAGFNLIAVGQQMLSSVPLWLILGYFIAQHLKRLKSIEKTVEEIRYELAGARLQDLIRKVEDLQEFKSSADSELASLWKAFNLFDSKRKTH